METEPITQTTAAEKPAVETEKVVAEVKETRAPEAATEAVVADFVTGDALERAEEKMAEVTAAAVEKKKKQKQSSRVNGHSHRASVSSRNPVPNDGIKRLAHRGGVKRISHSSYGACRESLGDFLRKVLKDAAIYTQCAKRNTIFVSDMLVALERSQNIKLYGYEK